MSERQRLEPGSDVEPVLETLMSDSDIAEFEKVLAWMRRIDDAYEPGSSDNVSELIMAMKADCDPDIILFLQEARRHDSRWPPTDQVQ